MLVYLSKKIAVPKQVKLNCISWNRDQGWLAFGGDGGLLKVLKLESSNVDPNLQGINASSNLSMNENLEGHDGNVLCVTWNPLFRKLTTSDENGLITVWMLSRGTWQEEMVNNRNKSVVRDMKWSSEGKKICIVYEDGAVIVGSVDGNRLWGKDLNIPLKFVEWSPDCKLIYFVTMDSDVWIYDADGNRLRNMQLPLLDPSGNGDINIVGIHWHCSDGSSRFSSGSSHHYSHPDNAPSLCIVTGSGIAVLTKGDEDPHPVVINTEMTTQTCKWSNTGTVIAFTGTAKKGEAKVMSYMKFYDTAGKLLRMTRVPGEKISGICWEGNSLRLALAVDSSIFFANVRPSYTWAYLLNTVIYSYTKPDRRESALIFWDLTSGEAYLKVVSGLKFLVACNDYCAVVSQEKETERAGNNSSSNQALTTSASTGQKSSVQNEKVYVYKMQLRNTIGAVLDSKLIPFAPKCVFMGPYHVVAVNERTVYAWQFQSVLSRSAATSAADGAAGSGSSDGNSTSSARAGGAAQASKSRERIFDAENTELLMTAAQSPDTFKILTEAIADPIACGAIDDKFLFVARKSGLITRYTLPHLSRENTYNCKTEPFRLEINCNSTRLAIIDSAGILTVLDLEAQTDPSTSVEEKRSSDGNGVAVTYGRRLALERRDVWDMKWAEDNDEMLCVMEKTKLVVFKGETAEDPIASSGYLARFKDLEVRAVSLDQIMVKPEQPNKDLVVDYETTSLREARNKIISEGLQGAYAFVDKTTSHPRLWRLLAQSALEDLDLNMAERAFVRCGDYYGIQLIKQLRAMPDKMKARAEVAVYLKKFDEAENIYREIDRKDLAIQMRRKIGDDTRAVQLLQTGGGSDQLTRDAWNRIGEYYTDRFKWQKAVQYFQQSKDFERLAECYYRLEDLDALSKLRSDISDGSPLLLVLASRFESVGMFAESADCYLRSGNPKAAVDCCVSQNRWDMALELAEQHDYPQVEGLLTRYASKLTASGRQLEAVELYRRANKPTEAALLIGEIAELAARRDVKPSLAKKLHILAAMEVERHRKRTMDLATQATMTGGGTIAQTTAATLETLMMTSLDTQIGGGATIVGGQKKSSKAFGNAWRGAAAYHYYMLAQRQLYAGNADAAMRTAIKLCEYDDILESRSIYSLLCIASLRSKFFGICSKAFVKLETLPDLPEQVKDEVQTLAVHIFVKHAPADPAPLPEPYIKCLEVGKAFKACVITGRAIQDSPAHTCRTCRHPMLENERERLLHCPLCHSSFTVATGATNVLENDRRGMGGGTVLAV